MVTNLYTTVTSSKAGNSCFGTIPRWHVCCESDVQRAHPHKPANAGGVMAVISKIRTAKHQGFQRGFTLLQLLIVVALVAVVSAFGFIGIRNVRAEMRLQNSARRFAVYLEKARMDSV